MTRWWPIPWCFSPCRICQWELHMTWLWMINRYQTSKSRTVCCKIFKKCNSQGVQTINWLWQHKTIKSRHSKDFSTKLCILEDNPFRTSTKSLYSCRPYSPWLAIATSLSQCQWRARQHQWNQLWKCIAATGDRVSHPIWPGKEGKANRFNSLRWGPICQSSKPTMWSVKWVQWMQHVSRSI